MARIRTIKPEAFSSDSLSQVPVAARWTFAGLWTFADDEGRCRDDPRLVKAHVYPLDDDITADDVAAHLDALVRVDCVRRYKAGGKRYLYHPGWAHQKISHPSQSKIPAPPEGPSGGPPEDSRGFPSDSGEPSPNGHGPTASGVTAGQTHTPESSGKSPESSGSRARAGGTGNREREQGREQGAGNARERASAAADPPHPPDDDRRPAVLAGISNELVAEYAAAFSHTLPKRFRAQLHEQVDTLLGEGFTREQVRAGLIALSRRRGAGAGLLPNLVHDALSGPAPTRRTGPDPNATVHYRGEPDETEFKAEVLDMDAWRAGA